MFIGTVGDEALTFAGAAPIALIIGTNEVQFTLRLTGGAVSDLAREGVAWAVRLHEKTGRARQFWIVGGASPTFLLFESGSEANGSEAVPIEGKVEMRRTAEGAELVATFALRLERGEQGAVSAQTFKDVVRSEFGSPVGRTVDLVPYVQEPNSVVALNPSRLPQVFRRII